MIILVRWEGHGAAPLCEECRHSPFLCGWASCGISWYKCFNCGQVEGSKSEGLVKSAAAFRETITSKLVETLANRSRDER